MTHMSNKSNNGTNKNASNARKGSRGPRPIMTVAQLREKMLRELMIKEGRKIERKITKLIKRENALKDRLYDTQTALDNLRSTLAEFNAELGA